MKEQNITQENWNNLIILDACRYDIFEKIYSQFLEGNLEKRISKGSSTGEWLVKTFPGKYDITYVSSNANVNSVGVPCFWGDEKWIARDHFKRIIDVWEFGWDENLKTIPPEEVNKAYLDNCKSSERTIIHYMQPHAPYFSFNHQFLRAGTVFKLDKENISINNIAKSKLAELGFWFEGKLGKINSWKLRKLLRLDPRNPLEDIWRRCDKREIISYYEDNLERVLEKISDLVKKFEGKTVVTADHGESFGEEGIWEHPSETHIPVLTKVPWLIVRD